MIQRKYAPFIHTQNNTPFIELCLLASLLPCVCLSVAYYGLRALILIVVCAVLFFISDMICTYALRPQDAHDYYDLSSLSEGVIFALLLPPDTAIYIAIVGVLFASVVVKQLFGGKGHSPVNPAVAGRLFLSLSFPTALTGFAVPVQNWFSLKSLILGPSDNSLSVVNSVDGLYFVEIFTGRFAFFMEIGCGFVILIGALFLLSRKLLKVDYIAMYLLAILLFYPIFHGSDLTTYQGIRDYVAFVLSSGVLFIAVYIPMNFSSVPLYPSMRMLAGGVCGMLTAVLYTTVSADIALCAPVVAVGLVTPLLDLVSASFSIGGKTS